MVDWNKIRHVFAIIVTYFCTAAWVVTAWREFYKLNRYVSRQCQVNSVNIDWRGKKFQGIWEVTVLDEHERSYVLVREGLSKGLKEQAWDEAQKYQINQTYICYGPPLNQRSAGLWDWHWNKTSKFKFCVLALAAMVFFIAGTLLLRGAIPWIIPCKTNRKEQHQQELQRPIRNDEQQE
ncbi:unnamed protein product [Adineta steineri]|uniref:Uncharacterized protein n=1 Tax=Adineta steineri TaxID=433720 RepID=A0A814N1Q8_9BILA|nr:unnamed protein product [Adineta steineri]CAF1175535.1 unnamed protein product [Adineta steineri]